MTQEHIYRDALKTSCDSVEMVAWAIARHYSLDAAQCNQVHGWPTSWTVTAERHALWDAERCSL